MNHLFLIVVIVCLFLQLPQKASGGDRYSSIFRKVCTTLKIDSTLITLTPAEAGIAECINIPGGHSKIQYNPDEFDKFTINYFVGVICHELAHYVNKDKNGCKMELEGKADLQAGIWMRQLGFDLYSSQLFLKVYKGASTQCYPTQDQRETFVRQGWDSSNRKIVLENGYDLLAPRVTWEISDAYELIVHFGDRDLTYDTIKKWRSVVIVYDSITTSTIQLFDYSYQRNAKGLARIVTSQTQYAYFAYPRKSKRDFYYYEIFKKGILIDALQCPGGNTQQGQDLIIHCVDNDRKSRKCDYRLVDFFLAPDYYVLPVVYN